jgi:uncharacterized protein with HEPN domain
MDERIIKWLFDVKFAIKEIDTFFITNEKDYFKYQKNIMLKRAVERNLEIIGEAISRILKLEPTFALKITNSKAIVSLRNQVIHAYDNISDESICSVLINHLPKLKIEIDELTSK